MLQIRRDNNYNWGILLTYYCFPKYYDSSLELPCLGGSNERSQSLFLFRKKNNTQELFLISLSIWIYKLNVSEVACWVKVRDQFTCTTFSCVWKECFRLLERPPKLKSVLRNSGFRWFFFLLFFEKNTNNHELYFRIVLEGKTSLSYITEFAVISLK